jgi:hypothetical protein
VPLSNVIKYFPFGVCRRFAPPPSLAPTVPEMVCGSKVNVTVGVSVAGNVMESVSGTGLGEPVAVAAVDVMTVVVIAVIVPFVGAMEVVNEGVEVLKGRGLLVVVAARLGVWDGSGVS